MGNATPLMRLSELTRLLPLIRARRGCSSLQGSSAPDLTVAPTSSPTFIASASGTSITVTWANIPSTPLAKIGRSSAGAADGGPWDTTMAVPPEPPFGSSGTITFLNLIQGGTYTLTLTEADGSTLTATATVPAPPTPTPTPTTHTHLPRQPQLPHLHPRPRRVPLPRRLQRRLPSPPRQQQRAATATG